MVHHHGHRADALLVQHREQRFGLFRALALLHQLGSHVLDAEPDGPQAAFAADGEQILVFVNVELGGLGAEEHRVAEWLAEHAALGHFGEHFVHRLTVIEEVVVGAEVFRDACGVADVFEFLPQPLRAFPAEGELVVGRDRAVAAMELAAVRGDD